MRLILFHIGLLVLACAAPGLAQQPAPPEGAVYGIEQGSYRMVNRTPLTEIATTVYWRDWGRQRVQRQTITATDDGAITRVMLLFTPDAITEVNLDTGQAKQRAVPPAQQIAASRRQPGELLSDAMYRVNGFTETGKTRDLNGRRCTVNRRLLTDDPAGPRSEVCLWQGIPIETRSMLFGPPTRLVATDFDLAPVDASLFTLPDALTHVDSFR